MSSPPPPPARREGGRVLVTGLPEGSEFGIDCQTWRVGPRFGGLRGVPAGVHFVHCGLPRTGVFVVLGPGEAVLLRWDEAEARLGPPGPAPAPTPAPTPTLAPYPRGRRRRWAALSALVDRRAVERLQPSSRTVLAQAEVLPVLALPTPADRARALPPAPAPACRSYREGLRRLPALRPGPGTRLRFTPLPRRLCPHGAHPAEVTRNALDRTSALRDVLRRRYPHCPGDLLAELQFAFICFLIGHVYDAFEHWKELLDLLCRSEVAMTEMPDFYSTLITVLYHQLNEVPPDFFVDIVSQDNFLTTTLQVFFSYIGSPTVDRALRRKAEKFKVHLTKKFKWDFEEEPEDCAPVVVELPEGVVIPD
ncbi:protein AAR2 homolog [Ornithorhynchus anatinus]|uniref:Protein AAR2 homolog n=1 Tax=Ornithorhynchus anatinus TaxID=9258 RepID=A0A6I8NII6_ORNAN|nr:protein AAR2 homolog [Ornithorhynchus anatinus]